MWSSVVCDVKRQGVPILERKKGTGSDLVGVVMFGEMVTSHFAVKSKLISLLLLNRQNLFPVSNNSCPCASIHFASKYTRMH